LRPALSVSHCLRRKPPVRPLRRSDAEVFTLMAQAGFVDCGVSHPGIEPRGRTAVRAVTVEFISIFGRPPAPDEPSKAPPLDRSRCRSNSNVNFPCSTLDVKGISRMKSIGPTVFRDARFLEMNDVASEQAIAKHRIPVIDRMMDVLFLLEKRTGGATIRDLVDLLRLPRTTVYRLLNT